VTSSCGKAFVERFNGTMRDGGAHGEEFDSLLEARVVIANWLVEYNTLRLDGRIGGVIPRRLRRRRR
jgi:transposase InsO family protein